MRLSVTKDPDSPGDVSQFQALTTALASTIGTGNIIGVGTAIFLGRARRGALMLDYRRVRHRHQVRGVPYRGEIPGQDPDGKMQGGALTAVVIIGGIKSIASVCEKLVPLMAVFYVAGCIIILCLNHDFPGQTIAAIVKAGLHPRRGGRRAGGPGGYDGRPLWRGPGPLLQ